MTTSTGSDAVMEPVRIYVPGTPFLLRGWRETGQVEVAEAHAVTRALAAALDGADEEELAWSALTTAAQASLALPADDGRRLVLVVDARGAAAADDAEDPTRVRLEFPAAWKRAAAIHADLPDAARAVTAAREAYAAGSPDAERLAEACLDHELGWFGVQELDDLLG